MYPKELGPTEVIFALFAMRKLLKILTCNHLTDFLCVWSCLLNGSIRNTEAKPLYPIYMDPT